MKTETKITHTPTPWGLEKTGVVGVGTIITAHDGDSRIAIINGTSDADTQDEANAAFIVRAVNNFDEMLGFIKNMAASDNHDGNRAKEIVAHAEGR